MKENMVGKKKKGNWYGRKKRREKFDGDFFSKNKRDFEKRNKGNIIGNEKKRISYRRKKT